MSPNLNMQTQEDSLQLSQKELGAYYTPKDITEAICKWAIQSPNEYVLEPSFGGCGFLESAIERLTQLGCDQPHSYLFGSDIDPKAFDFLSEKLKTLEVLNKRFLQKDFLQISPLDFQVTSFQSVIGNPPYISLHNLTDDQKISVMDWRKNHSELNISQRASLWAYFVLHSMQFLNENGRMAWVLPGSFLDTFYGEQLQRILLAKFGFICILTLGERAFIDEGTEERTVVLLCDRFGESTESATSKYCSTLVSLVEALNSPETIIEDTDGLDYKLYQEILQSKNTVTLGDVCSILIGTVTGANNFFVLNPSTVNKLRLEDEYLNPILAKFNLVEGISVSHSDVEKWKANNHRCLILHAENESSASDAVKTYASTFDRKDKDDNKTFMKRLCWLAADDKRIPDAFFSYMNDHGPKLALNEAQINCTNSIHRVFFNKGLEESKKKLAVISLLTTFSQISAELESRSYGSGVLKIEPSNAKCIKLVLPDNRKKEEINATYRKLNSLMRKGMASEIERLANEFIFPNTDVSNLSNVLNLLRSRRRRK
jgi:adenine-specific DNA-methyltransferase